MLLIDKYRPRRLSQVLGQRRACRVLQRIIGGALRDGSGFAVWLEGGTGQGKTSLAHGIAHALGVDVGAWNYTELDGSACTVDQVRALDDTARRFAGGGLFGQHWRVFVVNEAHAMTEKAVQAWLTLLEPTRLPRRWCVVFTTTKWGATLFGEFSQPFIDRTVNLRLTNQGLCPLFARLAHKIATREGLNGRTLADYEKLLKRCHNSMRAALQAVQAGEMLGD